MYVNNILRIRGI